jgi:hypothetical protein
MSTKPTDVGRFAVDGSDHDAANISPPSSGRRDTGYTLNYVPPSSEANYLENVAYRWRRWLNDGDVAFNTIEALVDDTITFNASIVVRDAPVFNSTINANGGLFLPNNASILSQGLNLWNCGNTNVDFTHASELDVDGKVACGDLLVSGNLTTDTSGLFTFQQWASPDFTFTANASTDSVASSGPTFPSTHLRTGDGPLRVSNSGGSLPGGLSAGTDYYWIGDLASVGQLATSRQNALNGVVIDITSTGSGTHTLLHQATTTRVGDITVGRNFTVNGTSTLTGASTLTGPSTLVGASTMEGAVTVGGQSALFTNFTFTANSTNDQLTATGHPLLTGDGPVRVANSGGGLPGGLSAVVNYWVVKIDANTFQLATSLEKALAGFVVDITSNGTGTQTLSSSGTTRVSSLAVNGTLTVNGLVLNSECRTYLGSSGIEQAPDVTKVSRSGGILTFLATRTGTNGILYPLALPVGTTINRIGYAYNRAGNTLAFSIVVADLDTGSVGFLQTLVNDSGSSGFQLNINNNLAVNGSGHPTGSTGSLTVRWDRAYWILAECTFTSGSPNIYGLIVNPPV